MQTCTTTALEPPIFLFFATCHTLFDTSNYSVDRYHYDFIFNLIRSLIALGPDVQTVLRKHFGGPHTRHLSLARPLSHPQEIQLCPQACPTQAYTFHRIVTAVQAKCATPEINLQTCSGRN